MCQDRCTLSFYSGSRLAANVVVGVQLLFASGNVAAGDVTLYALSNA